MHSMIVICFRIGDDLDEGWKIIHGMVCGFGGVRSTCTAMIKIVC